MEQEHFFQIKDNNDGIYKNINDINEYGENTSYKLPITEYTVRILEDDLKKYHKLKYNYKGVRGVIRYLIGKYNLFPSIIVDSKKCIDENYDLKHSANIINADIKTYKNKRDKLGGNKASNKKTNDKMDFIYFKDVFMKNDFPKEKLAETFKVYKYLSDKANSQYDTPIKLFIEAILANYSILDDEDRAYIIMHNEIIRLKRIIKENCELLKPKSVRVTAAVIKEGQYIIKDGKNKYKEKTIIPKALAYNKRKKEYYLRYDIIKGKEIKYDRKIRLSNIISVRYNDN